MPKKGILFYALIIIGLLLISPYFIQNMTWLLSEQSLNEHIHGEWAWVLFYIILFSFVFLFLGVKQLKSSWKNYSLYIAFIAALFAEMFGFPLSLYFFSSFIGTPNVNHTVVPAFTFTLFGRQITLLLTSLIASIISVLAVILIIFAWKQIYKAGGLVTNSVYHYIRHPQYLGLIIIVTAWLFAWPTLTTLILFPIMVTAYYYLSKKEDKLMEQRFGKKFLDYRKKVPAFLPFTK